MSLSFLRPHIYQGKLTKPKKPDLKIKEVHLLIEIFTILENGRRAQLSIARFSQTKGAASSFRKVVDAVEKYASDSGLLVEDMATWDAMRAVLNTEHH